MRQGYDIKSPEGIAVSWAGSFKFACQIARYVYGRGYSVWQGERKLRQL